MKWIDSSLCANQCQSILIYFCTCPDLLLTASAMSLNVFHVKLHAFERAISLNLFLSFYFFTGSLSGQFIFKTDRATKGLAISDVCPSLNKISSLEISSPGNIEWEKLQVV